VALFRRRRPARAIALREQLVETAVGEVSPAAGVEHAPDPATQARQDATAVCETEAATHGPDSTPKDFEL